MARQRQGGRWVGGCVCVALASVGLLLAERNPGGGLVTDSMSGAAVGRAVEEGRRELLVLQTCTAGSLWHLAR